MNKLRLLGSSALGSAALIGLNFALVAPAAAQVRSDETAAAQSTDPTAIPPQAPNADGSVPKASDEITVTGSRIRKSRTSGIDPVSVITNEERTEAGFNTSTDLLQSTAVTNGTSQINNAYGGFVTNGGPGANTLSLRGLGTSRSLVLVNGRRLAPSGSRGAVGSADLNSLPTAMVNRVEVLNAGASSIYGSDAIAGVVNVITRTNVKGLELSGQVNVPQAGAGVEYRLAAVFGLQAGNLRLNGSAEYYTRNALTFGDRDFTRCQTDYRLSGAGAAPDSGDYIDPLTGQPKCYGIAAGTGASGVTINTLGTQNFTGRPFRAPGTLSPTDPGQTQILTSSLVALAPGVPADYTGTCNRFRPNAAVGGTQLPGYECVGGGSLSTDIRNTFPPSLLGQALISPTTNYNGFLQGTYALNALGSAELYGELLASRRKSEQLGNRQLVIDYNQGSLLLPANLRNNTFLNYSAAGTPTGIPGTPVAARAFVNYGNYNNYQTSDFVKASGGIRGQLPYNWHYDLYASKSWSDSSYTTNLVLTNRLAQSLDVVASGNGFACRNPIGGCVAAPALSASVLGGQLPADFLNYITSPVVGTTKFRETVYNATIDGPLFRLPGGMVQVVLGAEQRSQSIDDSPSQESVNGNLYSFSSSTPTRGSDRVREVFGEVALPFIHKGFIYDLSVDASARYTNYRSYGGQWTYKIGGELSPVEWLKFRGSYGTSFRAPQLFEQFLGATSGFNAASTDICNNLSEKTAPVRLKNCLSEGLPLGFQATSGVAVLQRGGAASGLKSEKSRNINAGVVFQPTFSFGNLSLAADYFDIRVDNGVSQLSSGTIQSQCYDDPAFRANSVCNLVVRSSTAPYALTVTTGYVNISTSVLRGIDYTARFTAPVGPGKVRLGAQLTQFLKRYNQGLPTDPIVNVNGFIANPKWTGTFDAAYIINGFTLRYGAEWVQHTNSDAYIGGGDTYIFHTPDYWLHSLSVTYRSDRFEYGIGVRNLTNKTPPFISSGAYTRIGNAPLYSGYDFVGRTFFANVVAHF